MKLLRSFFVILSIFLLVEETISSKEVFVPRNSISDPLAVIRKRESSSWELALPHKSPDNVKVAGYYYDDIEDKNGRKDDFYIACPVHGKWGEDFEKQWKQTDESFKESHLFTLVKYKGPERCKEEAKPSIQKLKQTDENNKPIYCGKSEAEIYEVGYPVLVSEEGPTAEFMSIYKICHSKAKGVGTLYTIQQIVSPDLLLLEKRTWHEPKILNGFRSYLDDELRSVDKFYTTEFIYRFVGPYFMPTRIWERTTMFPFNFTPIHYHSIFLGLLRADKFIQVFSKTTNTPLTLYSSTYEKTITIPSTILCGMINCSKDVSVKLFWRILVDTRDRAIIIVTQLTQLDCDITKRILCRDKDTRIMMEIYGRGGCMYRCPVTDTIIEKLDLPATQLGLNIKGVLPLLVPKSQKNQIAGGSSDAETESQTEYSDMSDFMGDAAAFAVAVAAVDGGLAAIMEADSGGAADGQGDGEGGLAHNDGHGHGEGEGGGGGGGEGGGGGGGE